jgi:hypothetical protein
MPPKKMILRSAAASEDNAKDQSTKVSLSSSFFSFSYDT